MNHAASYLALFGIFAFVLSFIRHGRDGKAIAALVADPKLLALRQTQRRRGLIVGIAIALGSWALAAILLVFGIDVSPLSLRIISTSVIVLIWVLVWASSTWRLRKMYRKLELSGDEGGTLSKTIDALQSARLRWLLLFGLMAGLSLLTTLSDVFSAAAVSG